MSAPQTVHDLLAQIDAWDQITQQVDAAGLDDPDVKAAVGNAQAKLRRLAGTALRTGNSGKPTLASYAGKIYVFIGAPGSENIAVDEVVDSATIPVVPPTNP